MYKIFIYLFIFILHAQASDIKSENSLQIIADSITVEDNIITAKSRVLMFSKIYYMTANKIVFDKTKNIIELFGNVNISKNNESSTISEYAFLDISKEVDILSPVLLLEKDKLWMNSDNANQVKNIIQLNNTNMSSCECVNPVWRLWFSSGDFNQDEHWINTYNATLFIKDIPIFYMPYLGFPTDKKRRSGLLKPNFGISNAEGVFYSQPLYYALSDNYDIEYTPSIRSNRGIGHNLKYRYVDSKYSQLYFETGVFNEKQAYFDKSSLTNKSHHGWSLKYHRSNIFTDQKSDTNTTVDNLNIKLNKVNDIDYLYTKNSNINANTRYTNKFMESNIEYFYGSKNYYFNLLFSNYDDLSTTNNDTTMQSLPQINFHIYSDKTFFDIVYSLDSTFTNYNRIDKVGARHSKIDFPMSVTKSFLNDYIKVSATNDFYLENLYYSNSQDYDDATYLSHTYGVDIEMNLLKKYENVSHEVNYIAKFNFNDDIIADGDLYGINNTDEDLEPFEIEKNKQNIYLEANQNLYSKTNSKNILTHKINQVIQEDENGTFRFSDIANEITYFFDSGSLSNRITYNKEDKRVTHDSYSLNYKHDNFKFNIDYIKNATQDSNTKNLKFNFSSKLSHTYSLAYKEEFDIKNSISEIREITLKVNKKCWGVDFKLSNNLLASSSTDDGTLRQNVLYINLNFKPLFGFEQKHILRESYE